MPRKTRRSSSSSPVIRPPSTRTTCVGFGGAAVASRASGWDSPPQPASAAAMTANRQPKSRAGSRAAAVRLSRSPSCARVNVSLRSVSTSAAASHFWRWAAAPFSSARRPVYHSLRRMGAAGSCRPRMNDLGRPSGGQRSEVLHRRSLDRARSSRATASPSSIRRRRRRWRGWPPRRLPTWTRRCARPIGPSRATAARAGRSASRSSGACSRPTSGGSLSWRPR